MFRYILAALLLVSPLSFINAKGNGAELAVHLLSYLSQDYGEAVSQGEVTSQGEYDEQVEFINEVSRISNQANFAKKLESDVEELKRMILEKESVQEVSFFANKLKFDVIKAFNIATFPTNGLDFQKAKQIYAQSCVGCHGVSGAGDGPLGKNLEPKPTNFHGLERMQNISPFQAYNTITLGVNGTGMASYSFLSEKDRWSLAFYVSAFRYKGNSANGSYEVPLKDLASKTDLELLSKYNIEEEEEALFLASVRDIGDSFPPSGTPLKKGSEFLETARSKLGESFKLFAAGNFQGAKDKSLEAYLQGIEPIEGYLTVNNRDLVLSLEQELARYRALLTKDSSKEVVEQKREEILSLLKKADGAISSETSFVSSALISFGIVVREALEAGLVLLLLVGLVKKFGSAKTMKYVHFGWGSAILGGAILYFLVDMIIGLGGYAVEAIEGYVALFASIVLFYVGFWFHRNGNIQELKANLKANVKNSLVDNKKGALFFISFFAVFREIFETLLFMKILAFDGHSSVAIGAGAAFALGLAGALILLAAKFSVKLKLAPLFKGSTYLILGLSVVFLGKALGAFQKVGLLDQTQIDGFTLSILGYNSTLEVLLGQVAFILAVVGIMLWMNKKDEVVVKRVEN